VAVTDAVAVVVAKVAAVPVAQTHPVPAKLVIGGAAQVGSIAQALYVDVGGSTLRFWAWTSTGMACPVPRLKAWWPSTVRMLATSPEWLVTLIQVLSSLLNTSFKTVLAVRVSDQLIYFLLLLLSSYSSPRR
jgi:hypothetical protein